jgi:hypothetical protein
VATILITVIVSLVAIPSGPAMGPIARTRVAAAAGTRHAAAITLIAIIVASAEAVTVPQVASIAVPKQRRPSGR